MPKKFDFVEAYRKMQPNAAQEIVEARQKSHEKLYPVIKTMGNVYELCQLAFDFKQEMGQLTEWFQSPVKEFDPRFVLSIDTAEAARIAALLLRDLMSRGSPQGALAVLVSSFGGQRSPVDPDLLIEARDVIFETARAQRIVASTTKIAAPAPKDLKEQLAAIQGGWNPDLVRGALDATTSEARSALTKTASSANDAHQALRNDVVRLAEEVDMLWWHIADWSERLEQARTELPKEVVGVVSGVELGQFVRHPPGPYGTYGLLRRSLGKLSDKKAKLRTVVDTLNIGTTKLAAQIPSLAMSVFPVHTAILFASQHGVNGWPEKFDQSVGLLKNFELPHFDLAVHTFRERVLIRYAGLGE